MYATLLTLELTVEQLRFCRAAVEQRAYFKWLDAGRPAGRDIEFWRAAEIEWMGTTYVPPRPFDGDREPVRSRSPEEAAGQIVEGQFAAV